MNTYVHWHAAKQPCVAGQVYPAFGGKKLTLSVETVKSLKVRTGLNAGGSSGAPCGEIPFQSPGEIVSAPPLDGGAP